MSFARMGLMSVALTSLLVSITGCDRNGAGNSSSSRAEYSRLAANYNALLDQQKSALKASHALQLAAQKENRFLVALDLSLGKFAAAIDDFYAIVPENRPLTKREDEAAISSVDKIGAAHRRVMEALVDVEGVILDEQAALYANAEIVYKEPAPNRETIAAQEKLFRDRSMQLLGVRNVIASNMAQLRRYAATLKVTVPAGPAQKKVDLNERDKEVERVVGSTKASGFARDARGALLPLSDVDAIRKHARSLGFSEAAATDGAAMAAKTGGVVAFSNSAADIPKAVVDVLAHIKPQLNTNTDDLELALVIDYSGSMQDKIAATLKGLKDVVESLKNVVASGRNVRVGLVTFGEPGKEKVELDFTRNMAVVQQELDRLNREYATKQHSTDPGEASFHGLEIAAKKMTWASKNRLAIAITDEPSQELQLGDTKYVDSVYAALRKGGIQSRIYTIVVK